MHRSRHFMRASQLLVLALAVLLSPAAQAQQNVPSKVKAAIEERRKSCDGQKFTTKPGFITRRDINGDGVDDFILNYENAGCGVFCGTGGCTFQVFVSLSDGDYVKVMDDNAYDVKFQRLKGRPAMIQFLHGVNCGRVGANGGCQSVTYWNGFRFSPAVPVR